MQEMYKAASNRIRRRLDVMRLDVKMQGLVTLKHDIDEIKALLDIMDEQVERIINESNHSRSDEEDGSAGK